MIGKTNRYEEKICSRHNSSGRLANDYSYDSANEASEVAERYIKSFPNYVYIVCELKPVIEVQNKVIKTKL